MKRFRDFARERIRFESNRLKLVARFSSDWREENHAINLLKSELMIMNPPIASPLIKPDSQESLSAKLCNRKQQMMIKFLLLYHFPSSSFPLPQIWQPEIRFEIKTNDADFPLSFCSCVPSGAQAEAINQDSDQSLWPLINQTKDKAFVVNVSPFPGPCVSPEPPGPTLHARAAVVLKCSTN